MASHAHRHLLAFCFFFIIHLAFFAAAVRSIRDLTPDHPSPGHEGSRFHFHVKYTNITRLCHTKRIVTVNDQFPGPSLVVTEGDRVIVNVTNHLPDKSITIHWHGVRQVRTGWFDGPAYITQCPIAPGRSFVYRFQVTRQRGTLFWHAHISWMRASVHGALIIRPRPRSRYPFPTPAAEIPLVLGEWWNADTEAVVREAMDSGGGPNISDAYTINGKPGALYQCSDKDMLRIRVEANRTYLLRLVNAALNDEVFVSVAGHKLTVVEADACYTKPFASDAILLAPGQTTNVLLSTNHGSGGGRFALAVRAYNSAGPSVPFDNTTAVAVLEYGPHRRIRGSAQHLLLPDLPAYNDTASATRLMSGLRSLDSDEFPALVPKTVDRELLFTVGLARKPCPRGRVCAGPSGGKFAAAFNNISFDLPSNTSLLESFFSSSSSRPRGHRPQPSVLDAGNNHNHNHNHNHKKQLGNKKLVFATNFPDMPTMGFDFTGTRAPASLEPKRGTRVSWLAYNSSVQLVLQGTSILGTESHPIHLHGFNFFVVGQGSGNYDPAKDPASFNLVDPQERNTVNVPKAGWVALRFRADNPGVWFMHCHLEVHASWGLETAFLVPNGIGPEHSIEPPPSDLPSCQGRGSTGSP